MTFNLIKISFKDNIGKIKLKFNPLIFRFEINLNLLLLLI